MPGRAKRRGGLLRGKGANCSCRIKCWLSNIIRRKCISAFPFAVLPCYADKSKQRRQLIAIFFSLLSQNCLFLHPHYALLFPPQLCTLARRSWQNGFSKHLFVGGECTRNIIFQMLRIKTTRNREGGGIRQGATIANCVFEDNLLSGEWE